MRGTLIALVLAATATACARPPAGTLRFKPQEPVWKVDDAVTLEKAPKERVYNRTLYHLDGFVVRRVTRAMDLPDKGRAQDVNSIDEVPDSTWFTNRIGVRDVTIDEIRKGPNEHPSPFDNLPVTITGAKEGGTAIGFVVEDARRAKYLLKFDVKGVPEMETAAHVIGHRILWAAGYNVPEDHVGYLTKDQIEVDPEAKLKDMFGKKTPLTWDRVNRALDMVEKTPDGKIRVLLSRFVPGKPIGPYAREGTRGDDPNDRIAHEKRRSVRGQVPLFSWLAHTDLQEDNTLDAFVPASAEKGEKRGHVVHYLIDFGKALGVMNNSNNWKTVGYTYRIDLAASLATFLTLGTWDRPWDNIEQPPYKGVAVFESDHFDPSRWKPNSIYWPFEDADKFDGFWGAKIAMRFTPELLAAVIDEAKLTDPGARRYLLETLIKRQRILGRYWFGKVTPLDRFAVTLETTGAVTLCFDDLEQLHGFTEERLAYRVDVFDYAGKRLAAKPALYMATSRGRACYANLPLGAARDGYTIVKLAAMRGGSTRPAVDVHLSRIAGGKLAVIGLRRH
ncbi:MAG: hypothetical protein JNL83_20430 [Myxococcales bacterium]|nr:hypothetical protein [Myxococcales bacterium]